MEISTCLIGEDSLLIHCGNTLLSNNHKVSLVISPIKAIQEWAQEHQLPYLTGINELASIEPFEVDYLFSIVNSHILPDSILKLARRHAINYHDSILPHYAGVNSTSWAIINEEKQHGITWHIMSQQVDAGDIISQEVFPIKEDDTALTLNLRCYQTAIRSFTEMLQAIEKGSLLPQQQLLQERSYFSCTEELPSFGFIDWENFSAQMIERISRAVTFGHYENKLGTLKLLLNEDYILISYAKVTGESSPPETLPGTILAIKQDALYVSTSNQTIKISSFLSKEGGMMSVEELVERHQLFVGARLPYLNNTKTEFLKQQHRSALRFEHYWLHIIENISEHNAFSSKMIRKDRQWQSVHPAIYLHKIFPSKMIRQISPVNYLVTAVLVYLYRINNQEQITVSVVHPDYDKLDSGLDLIFAKFLPFVFDQASDFSLQMAYESISRDLDKLNKNCYLLSDISARYPILSENRIKPSIVINLNGSKKNYPCQDNSILYINLDEHCGEIEVLHRIDLLVNPTIKELIINSTQHLVNVLTSLISYPHVNARQVNFLTQSEQYKLLTVLGRGKERYIFGHSIVTQFEAQVTINPKQIAIYVGDKTYSYLELSKQVNKIASYLRYKNLPKQTLIGIYLSRSFEMIAVILGILKANCAYVPLDRKYPILKIEQIIEDSNISFLFVTDKAIDQFSEFFIQQNKKVELFKVSTILSDQKTFPETKEEQVTSEALAYIMFTSGTTGRPKGVVVTQKNVINYCKWFTETTHFDELGIIDFSSSIAFDLSIPCTIAPLLAGGSIAIASTVQKNNPRSYLAYLKKNKITHIELTPGYLEILLHYPEDIKELTDLKFLLLGADVVPVNDVRKWLSLCPWHQIVNEYGPTETTVSVTSYFVNKDTLGKEASVPIGRPGFNTNCYVLDKYNNLCPIGIKGELCVGGAQVTQGYLNREDLTATKYIRSSFINPKEVIYKTGDVVCWLSDGNLQFFGRNDHQIKIQGYRVDPQAIESLLLKVPEIHQALVVVLKGKLNEQYLRAYLVSDKKIESSCEIRTFLASYLPSYMIPREFCVIKTIPLKENEKIDFNALEKQNCQLLTFNTHTPNDLINPVVQEVKHIWEKIFYTNFNNTDDDFFAIGGDSLMAIQMISELKTIYNKELPLQILFEYPTIAALAKEIEKLTKEVGSISRIFKPLIKLSSGEEEVPLFLIHPVGGSIFWYKQLGSYLQGGYTVYGIQDISIEGSNLRFSTLEEMASYYLHEIKKVYSGDTYCLGGASFGATVAFEMAHQLISANQTIKFLGLFDGWAAYPPNIMQENTLDWLDKDQEKKQLLNSEQRKMLIKLEEYRKNLLANYQLRSLSTDATLFKSAELWPAFASIDDPKNGWGPYIGGNLLVHKVSGNHETMFFAPHVSRLANSLLERLQEKEEVDV